MAVQGNYHATRNLTTLQRSLACNTHYANYQYICRINAKIAQEGYNYANANLEVSIEYNATLRVVRNMG